MFSPAETSGFRLVPHSLDDGGHGTRPGRCAEGPHGPRALAGRRRLLAPTSFCAHSTFLQSSNGCGNTLRSRFERREREQFRFWNQVCRLDPG